MLNFLFRRLFLKKHITPKDLKEKYGAITKSNETNLDLVNGAERQWRKYCYNKGNHGKGGPQY